MEKTLNMTDDQWRALRMLLDNAGNKLSQIATQTGDDEAKNLADGCDQWLEIVECL